MSYAVKPTSERKEQRKSSIELFRIFSMLIIIAHHFVYNSQIPNECFDLNQITPNMIFLQLFGCGGKFGIDCFTLITGFFMVEKKLTVKKVVSLWTEILFYKILIGLLFLVTGQADISMDFWFGMLFPFSHGAGVGYVGSMLCLYLLIPFLNIVLNNICRKQYLFLLFVLVWVNSICPSILLNSHDMDYVSWLIVLYAVGGFIKKFPSPWMDKLRLNLAGLIFTTTVVWGGIIFIEKFGGSYAEMYSFIYSDANKILPFAASVFAFNFFRSWDIGYHRLINELAASSFGVLLIHGNDNIRPWLWGDVLNNTSFYNDSLLLLALKSVGSVLSVYLVCALIDGVRRKTVEKPIVNWTERVVNRALLVVNNKITE